MKKVISLLLVCFLVAVCLVACADFKNAVETTASETTAEVTETIDETVAETEVLEQESLVETSTTEVESETGAIE